MHDPLNKKYSGSLHLKQLFTEFSVKQLLHFYPLQDGHLLV